jgi:hypothetical protein
VGGDGIFIDVTGGGVLGTHPERPEAAVAVAPSGPDQLNTIRIPLMAIACWLLPDHYFAFDSSLVHPDAQPQLTKFVGLRRRLTDPRAGAPPLSIFGHTDPVGPIDYNMQLGWRRARAVYALLTHDVAIWESLYSVPLGGDIWGRKALQMMLGALSDATGEPYYPGPQDGVWTQAWSDSIRRFQKDKTPEHVTGSFGTAPERAPLFDAYMSFLCVDEKGQSFRLSRTDDFLARGADPDGRGDLQGCSKFNLQMIFKQGEEASLGEKQRNEDNRVNRRVVVFIFKPNVRVKPEAWPCPAAADEAHSPFRAAAAVKACQARFWSDAAQRGEARKLPDRRRTFGDREDTFQCRFYHGFAVNSPCEDVVKLWVVRLATRDVDHNLVPLANQNAVVALGKEGNAVLLRTTSTKDGKLFLPVLEGETRLDLRFDALGAAGTEPKDAGTDEDPAEAKFLPLVLLGDVLAPMPPVVDDADPSHQLPVRQRLHNLGYGPRDLETWDETAYRAAVRQFKVEHAVGGADPDGTVDAETRDAVVAEYGS